MMRQTILLVSADPYHARLIQNRRTAYPHIPFQSPTTKLNSKRRWPPAPGSKSCASSSELNIPSGDWSETPGM